MKVIDYVYSVCRAYAALIYTLCNILVYTVLYGAYIQFAIYTLEYRLYNLLIFLYNSFEFVLNCLFEND